MARLIPAHSFLTLLLLGGGWPGAGPAGQGADDPAVSATNSKIRFDLHRLDDRGLQGPSGGLRALHYECCIPDRPGALRAVTAIDPTLEIRRGPPGRIGCGSQELLCLGHTHQPNQGAVLGRLAALPVIREIREAFFE